MNATNIEVERVYGAGGSTATVDLVFPTGVDPTPFRGLTHPETDLELTVEATTSFTDLENTDAGESRRIFTGSPTKVIQREDGTIRVEALDRRKLLNEHYVQVDTQVEGESTEALIDDFLGEELGLVRGTDYIIDFPEDSVVVHGVFGSEQPENLFQVLAELALIQDVHFWIDRENTIRFEAIPELDTYGLTKIVGFGSGSESNPNQSVIAQSPYDESGLGVFDFTGSSMMRAGAGYEGFSDTPGAVIGDRYTLNQANLTSTDAVDSRAVAEFFQDALTQSSGTVTVLGEPLLDPYDQVILYDLPDWAPVALGEYNVKAVRHIISPRNGYLTELELGDSLRSLFADLESTHEEAERREELLNQEIPDVGQGDSNRGLGLIGPAIPSEILLGN